MIKIKTNPLHQWQLDVIRLYDEHPKDSIITIKSPRQRGKTYLLTILALREAINNSNRNVVIICPSYNIARKQYRDFTKAIKKLPNVLTMNKSYLEIEFCNFSIIKFKSAESGDNLRGETADLLIFDEGSFIDLETALECFNFCNTTHGNIVIASTPTFRDENNLFYKYYKAGLDKELNCYTIDFCEYDTSSMLSKDRMELYKKFVFRCLLVDLRYFIRNQFRCVYFYVVIAFVNIPCNRQHLQSIVHRFLYIVFGYDFVKLHNILDFKLRNKGFFF
jgi:hypothetical protein